MTDQTPSQILARPDGATIAYNSIPGKSPGVVFLSGFMSDMTGTKAMALELAGKGIRVNALSPGYIKTDLNRNFLESEAGEKMVKRVPQRRFGEPEDLYGALLLLASDASLFMTGAVITVDGGHLVNSL